MVGGGEGGREACPLHYLLVAAFESLKKSIKLGVCRDSNLMKIRGVTKIPKKEKAKETKFTHF